MPYFPLDPSLDKDGRLRILIPLLGPKSSFPVAMPALDGTWDLELDSKSGATETYSKLGVSAVFSAQASLTSATLIWDALVGKRAVLGSPTPDSVITETFWGVGLRVGLTFNSAMVNADVSVSTLAAHAEFKALDVQYEIHSLGLGPRELAMVLRTIPPLGRFDLSAFSILEDVRRELVKALLNRLKDLDTAKESLRPAMIKLSVTPFPSQLSEAATYRFTLQSIEAGLDLTATLARLHQWKNVHQPDVERLFSLWVGGTGAPNQDARARARAWLDLN